MTRRISLIIAIAGAALVLVPTAAAAAGPAWTQPAMQARAEGPSTVVPMTAPFGGNRRAQLNTTQKPSKAPVPVATRSGSEIEWPQIGIGFALGIALGLGVPLVVRGTRERQLAH